VNREHEDEERWLRISVLFLWEYVYRFRRGSQVSVPHLLLPSVHRIRSERRRILRGETAALPKSSPKVIDVEAAKRRFLPFLLLSDLFQTLISSFELTTTFWLTPQHQRQLPSPHWHKERERNVQEKGGFEVNVLTITTEHCLLLGVAIDEESDNRSPGLLRSKEFEAIQAEDWVKITESNAKFQMMAWLVLLTRQ